MTMSVGGAGASSGDERFDRHRPPTGPGLPLRRQRHPRPPGYRSRGRAGPAAGRPRPVRQRQDHAPQPPRRPRSADIRIGRRRRPRDLGDGRRELVDIRRRTIAFVFQSFGLVPILSAAENVEIPLRLVRADPGRARPAGRRAAGARRPAAIVRGTGRTSCRAGSSSASRSPGRSPIGRGCCSPTSRPASSTPRPVTGSCCVLREVVRAEGITAIVATHDPLMMDVADRVVELQDGALVEP